MNAFDSALSIAPRHGSRSSSARLFDPVTFRGMTARNRIMMSAMCQYSAIDGMADDWHHVHYTSRAVGGAGLISFEMTAVDRLGRITPGCLGLWRDDQAAALAPIVADIRRHGAKAGLQLGHAGRKGEHFEQGLVAPSAIRFHDDWPVPHELSTAEATDLVLRYGEAAARADAAGFDYVEIHAAHGYLINQFLSPLSNRRTDRYGLDRRLFLMEVLEAVRGAWPAEKPIFIKLSVVERDEGGATVADVVDLARAVAPSVDLCIASSGAMTPTRGIRIDSFPGYQVPFAEALKREAGVAVAAVGMLDHPLLAEEVVKNGRADVVAVGREFLRDPYWPLHAARVLGIETEWPRQYKKAKDDWKYFP